jgi:FkbM family methyltransferase
VTLNKPEYIFCPFQILRRIAITIHQPGITDLRLASGARIRVNAAEIIGRSIYTQGVYDLATSEAISRLLDPGALAIDVGANIGWMTGVMARRLGTTGRVISFEPNPVVLEILRHNAQTWNEDGSLAPITLHPLAVSSRSGRACMISPAGFEENQGLATLEEAAGANPSDVETVTLDEIVGECHVGLMKVDVEGHELSVFKGAERLLSDHRVRDIIYEDHVGYRSAVSEYLRSFGYEISRISRHFLRPALADARDIPPGALAANYLATTDRLRAEDRFAGRGWQVLQRRDWPKRRT